MTVTLSVHELSGRVDAELRSIVTSRTMPLYQMMSYHMGWSDSSGGEASPSYKERTLGLLCLLACRASGGDPETALPAAAATELVHNFCEIHDDVQEGAPQREDRDALWWIWGPAQAINAGDGMHALARLSMFRLLDRGVSPETVFRALQVLDEASLNTCEGRFLDLEAQERIDLSLDAYVHMVQAKTGRLRACALRLGGLVAGGDEQAARALARSGVKLGVALQMRDDVRALWEPGSPDSAAATQVMNKKKLLPVVLAVEQSNISQKRQLGEVYFKRILEPDDVLRLRETLEAMGVREECGKLAERHGAEALEALEGASLDPAAAGELAGFMDQLLQE